MTLPELIASEVIDAIERERRINKDDMIMAAEVAIGKFKKQQEQAHPMMVVPTPTKPGCISSADAALLAGCWVPGRDNPFYGELLAVRIDKAQQMLAMRQQSAVHAHTKSWMTE